MFTFLFLVMLGLDLNHTPIVERLVFTKDEAAYYSRVDHFTVVMFSNPVQSLAAWRFLSAHLLK